MGEGSSPIFTPAGDQVIWVRDGHFWTAPAIGGKERKLFEIRGSVGAPQWSPDGSELAFVSTRGDHSFIAVYAMRTNQRLIIDTPTTAAKRPPISARSTNLRNVSMTRLKWLVRWLESSRIR